MNSDGSCRDGNYDGVRDEEMVFFSDLKLKGTKISGTPSCFYKSGWSGQRSWGDVFMDTGMRSSQGAQALDVTVLGWESDSDNCQASNKCKQDYKQGQLMLRTGQEAQMQNTALLGYDHFKARYRWAWHRVN